MTARSPHSRVGAGDDPSLLADYARVRRATERLAEPLSPEDCQVQSMPDASPTKWHLAHTAWFLETFVLARRRGFSPFNPAFGYLFNSYYDSVGPRQLRAERGLLSRPSLAEVYAYRRHVDAQIEALLAKDAGSGGDGGATEDERRLLVLGLHHEEQHQELLLTDILHALAQNEVSPAYRRREAGNAAPHVERGPAMDMSLTWVEHVEGLRKMGQVQAGGAYDRFTFDNEGPAHRVFVPAFAMASRLVTCAEFLAFMEDGGYAQPSHWLSDGWATVREENWAAPLYWKRRNGQWERFSFDGYVRIDPLSPVCHVSYYEADAYARWAKARLPTEAEWEVCAKEEAQRASNAPQPSPAKRGPNFLESHALAPHAVSTSGAGVHQLFGDTWEWTSSAYAPFPGFAAEPGAVGEYNGKFMSSQMVLRGGSCLSPARHIRDTYRNFFPPKARWQMTGIRLARSL